MRWFFGAHSLWLDILLSFDTGGSGLVLPQISMSDLIDSTRKVLPPMRSGWGMECGGNEKVGKEEGRGNWGWCENEK